MAIGVVKTFDDKLREEVNDVLIVRYIEHLKMDCLELAVWCGCKDFVAMRLDAIRGNFGWIKFRILSR